MIKKNSIKIEKLIIKDDKTAYQNQDKPLHVIHAKKKSIS